MNIKKRLILKDIKRKSEIEKLPIYELKKGLPIGNMTSQFLSIFYLYKLDHFIVNNLKLKHMVRYMDDYVIISDDKKKLVYALNKIIEKLRNEYKLSINTKKTFIVDSVNGFDFLGYRFKCINSKICIDVKNENLRRKKHNIKKNNYLFMNGIISYKVYFNSMSNYNNSYKYVSKLL